MTEGTLLGGRIAYRQSVTGHRSGVEPVLLAAAIPAQPSDRIIEAGTGAGAALLCLAHRVPGITGIGIERDPALARIAHDNVIANGATHLSIVAADIAHLPLTGRFDHAFTNPPWQQINATPSPDPGRRLAHVAPTGLLTDWLTTLARLLRPRGSLTIILPSASITDALAAMTASGCGACTIMPLWPRTRRDAKLVLVQGLKGARGPSAIRAGLVLHDEAGFTPEANAILREGEALGMEN